MIEQWRTKILANEAYLVYLMNKQSKIQIDTRMGMTNIIEVDEIVRQGTVFGPMLCGIVTDKINNFAVSVNESIETRTNTGTLMFVDDIIGTGSKANIEKTIRNCRAAESKKNMTFNHEKSNYIKISFKKFKSAKKEQIEEKVTNGNIKETESYKYLGDYINNKGNNVTNIEKRKQKIPYMIKEMMRYGDQKVVGEKALCIRLMIMETMIMPAILNNTEAWTNITEKEMETIEKVQKDILTALFHLPISTPYWAVLEEGRSWLMSSRIMHRKLMLFQNLIKSNKKRMAKKILMDQIEQQRNNCCYSELKGQMEKYEIFDGIEQMKCKTNEIENIIKTRLDMQAFKCNFKEKDKEIECLEESQQIY